jgi:uncharacterized membrane protein YkvA (DUF1232 family)
MELWQVLLLVIAAGLTTLVLAAWLLWRKASSRARAVAGRVQRLPWRAKFTLAGELMKDPRVPLRARLVLPFIVLYLATPIDFVPDFVPVLGQLDDILVVAVGLALIIRSTPMQVLEAHLSELEAPAPA